MIRPGHVNEIPWVPAVPIMTASTTGSLTDCSATHLTRKLEEEPPLVSLSVTKKS